LEWKIAVLQADEQAGMVGRLILGKPLNGPGTKPLGYDPDKKWMPEIARDQIPSIEQSTAKVKSETTWGKT
jgi:hypothetical protein